MLHCLAFLVPIAILIASRVKSIQVGKEASQLVGPSFLILILIDEHRRYLPNASYKAPLPDYIQDTPQHLANEDFQYIERKGALRLPSPSVRDTLWASYFQLVHPNCPILDCEEMLGVLRLDTGAPKISLLLFHSIMLAARLFLDAHETRSTSATTLQTMFNRARVLYDLGWEADPLVQLQSLLLMSFHPSQIDNPKGSAHIVSRVVSSAYALGLHRDPTTIAETSRAVSIRKQLWWSIYIRERVTFLDAGLPWLIHEENHEVPMLTLDDLVQAPLTPTGDATSLPDQPDHVRESRQLDVLLIEKAKLAVITGRLVPISMGSDVLNIPFGDSVPQAQCSAPEIAVLMKIERDLDLWLNNIPIELSVVGGGAQNLSNRHDDRFLGSCHASIMLFYLIVANQISSLRWLRVGAATEEAPEYAMKNLSKMTRPIIGYVEKLQHRKYLHFVQMNSPSIIRPILLCLVLNRNMPFWMDPFFDFDNIPSLFTSIGTSDSYFQCSSSYLQKGNDGFDALSHKPALFGSSPLDPLDLHLEIISSSSERSSSFSHPSSHWKTLSEASEASYFELFEANVFDHALDRFVESNLSLQDLP